jgi:TM2 domain containing protein
MDANKVDTYLIANGKFFKPEQIPFIREKLLSLDESKWVTFQSLPLKDTTTSLILSILIGGLGVDRFYIGDTGLGIFKLLTCGGFGVGTIVDWFLIMGATREKNTNLLLSAI